LGHEFAATGYFAADELFSRTVRGRQGWLNQVPIAILAYDGKLFFSPYAGPSPPLGQPELSCQGWQVSPPAGSVLFACSSPANKAMSPIQE
jgi:hypothetical protein